MTVQEAILRAKPAVVVIISQTGADITMNCGKGLVSVSPTPFVETGSGWFVDGRGYVVTSAHVVSPLSALSELKKAAIQEGCVDPELRAQGLARGQRPDVEERIRARVTDRAMATMTVSDTPSITVLLANGTKLPAEVKKLSPPLALDAKGAPLPDAGRDLALLRVKDGVYSALDISTRHGQIGDSVHILGFPSLILTHELLDKSISLEASVTNGAISGFRKDAIRQDVIQTDAPATYGSSGGPAIGNDAALVGVMTFVSVSPSTGNAVQGFNFLVPAKGVRKFLEGTDVHIGESRFNPPWADALGAFFKGDYPAAAAKLTKVNALVPNLPDVKRVLAESQEKAKHPPASPFPVAWVALGITLVSAGIYGGLFGHLWWKYRFRILPAQIIGALEDGLGLKTDCRRSIARGSPSGAEDASSLRRLCCWKLHDRPSPAGSRRCSRAGFAGATPSSGGGPEGDAPLRAPLQSGAMRRAHLRRCGVPSTARSTYGGTPRVRPSGAASQLDPSHRSSRVSPTGS